MKSEIFSFMTNQLQTASLRGKPKHHFFGLQLFSSNIDAILNYFLHDAEFGQWKPGGKI